MFKDGSLSIFKKVFLQQKLNLEHWGVKWIFYFLTTLMGSCIEMTITWMCSYYCLLFTSLILNSKKYLLKALIVHYFEFTNIEDCLQECQKAPL